MVLAICIRESRPSCMRAPPDAVKLTNGTLCSIARVHAAHEALAHHRAHRAAHEVELEARGDHRHAHQAPPMTTSASVSPVFSAAPSDDRGTSCCP